MSDERDHTVCQIEPDMYEVSWADRWCTVYVTADPWLVVTGAGRELKPGSALWRRAHQAVVDFSEASA